jgi:hypothetical protein
MNARNKIITTSTICMIIFAAHVAAAAETVTATQATAPCKACGESSSKNNLGARTSIKKDYTVTEEQEPHDANEVTEISPGAAVSSPNSDAVPSPQSQAPEE